VYSYGTRPEKKGPGDAAIWTKELFRNSPWQALEPRKHIPFVEKNKGFLEGLKPVAQLPFYNDT